jgi:hypothetical protein
MSNQVTETEIPDPGDTSKVLVSYSPMEAIVRTRMARECRAQKLNIKNKHKSHNICPNALLNMRIPSLIRQTLHYVIKNFIDLIIEADKEVYFSVSCPGRPHGILPRGNPGKIK